MQRLMKIMVIGLVALSFILQACGSKPEPTQIPAALTEGTSALATKPAWEQEWERTLSAARKEGKVTMYSGYMTTWRQAFSEAMAKKFSITLEMVTARTQEGVQRLIREQQIGVNNADVISVSSAYVEPLNHEGVLQPLDKMLILPEVVDPKAWFRGELTWYDPDGKTCLIWREAVTPPWVINTDLVKPGELKSWNDLLDPKWKKRILLNDPTLSGAGQMNMMVLVYGVKDRDFINALLKQEPELQRDFRLMAEWVARGKFPISIGIAKENVFEFKQAGAPIQTVTPSEGTYTSAGDGSIALVKTSPHPNAAKVFINFFFSKEGQTITSKATGLESSRIDVPTDHLDPDMVRQPGIRYISTIEKGFLENEDRLRTEVAKMFRDYLTK